MKSMWVIILVCVMHSFGGYIHPQLAEKLSVLDEDETIDIIVHMKNQPDLSILSDEIPKAEKLQYLQQYARNDQKEILNLLANHTDKVSNLHPYWLFNGLALKTSKGLIEVLSSRQDVDYILDDFTVSLQKEQENGDIRIPEWNIKKIKADSCWFQGYDGRGIIIGNIDTGVDTSHPALQGKWVIGGWYDAVNGQPVPYDDNGHGIFSMGIICGGDGNGPFVNDIGVAPGAKFICAKALNASGAGQASWIHNSFQWFITQNAKIVNNPWSEGSITSLEFWNDCRSLRALGICPVFRIGSGGPSQGTANTPGNFPIVIGVGATDSNDYVASFSSRGPAPNQNPWNDTTNWGRPDWNLIKPDIAAPGVNIRSSYTSGGYMVMNGTSWATAHVSGAVAILLQKDSTVNYELLYQTLLDYADKPPQGAPYPNNNYGWGRLNIYGAVNALPVAEDNYHPCVNPRLFIYPNPFRNATGIKFQISNPKCQTVLKIYDASGRLVRQWDYQTIRQSDQILWHGTDGSGQIVPAGIYFIVLSDKDYRVTIKVLFVK